MATLPVALNTIPVIRPNGVGAAVMYENRAPAVAFYFSAHWCGPCKAFTPELARHYVPGKMEILFVSLDRNEDEFRRYHRTMPWPAVNYQDTGLRDTLKATLKISGIPALVTVSASGVILNHNARPAFMRAPSKSPWPEPTVQYLHESIEHRGGDINTIPSAVLYVPTRAARGGADEIAAFESVASQAPTDMSRFVALQGKGGAADMVAMAMGFTEEERCRLAVVDVSLSGGGFFPAADDVDLSNGVSVALFLANYRQESTGFQSLSR